MDSSSSEGGRHFVAWAFFLSPNDPDNDDAEGCMVKCWVSKYTKRKHLKFKISNRNIRAAMARDADDPIGWAATPSTAADDADEGGNADDY